MLSIDGSTGEVFVGEVPVVPSPVSVYLDEGLRPLPWRTPRRTPRRWSARSTGCWAMPTSAADWRCGPTPTPATTPPGRAAWERSGSGCAGPSTCSSVIVVRSSNGSSSPTKPHERDAALAALAPLQRQDFVELISAMDGLPVTIRLLDPPLHEFLPDRTELAVRVATAEAERRRVGGGSSSCSPLSSGCTRRTRCWDSAVSGWG